MSADGTVVVDAPRPRVWELVSDVARWPEWNPACVSAECAGELAPGARLDLLMRHPNGRTFITRPTVDEVEPGTTLAWSAKGMGFRARTRLTLRDGVRGTTVRMSSDTQGLMAFTYRMVMPTDVQGQMLRTGLDGLARTA